MGQMDTYKIQKYIGGQLKKTMKHLGLATSEGEITSKKIAAKLKQQQDMTMLEVDSEVDQKYKIANMVARLSRFHQKIIHGFHQDKHRRRFVYQTDIDEELNLRQKRVFSEHPLAFTAAAQTFIRDNFQCTSCGVTTLYLHAQPYIQIHHKLPLWVWARMSEENRASRGLLNPHILSNLRLLCVPCHEQQTGNDYQRFKKYL